MNKLRAILSTRPDATPNKPSHRSHSAYSLPAPAPKPDLSANPPRLILIGGGSRGSSLARAIVEGSNGLLVAVAEPDPSKRRRLGRNYIWGTGDPEEGEEFESWQQFLEWETARRKTGTEGNKKIDAAIICTPDRTHHGLVTGLAPLKLHIMCEKPLATTLGDCLDIYRQLRLNQGSPAVLFSVGHVMRYAPHNQLLRKLLREDHAIGDIVSIEHTENVGWWHFAHSYVRGNWRKASTSGPTLLTKSCHDIDFLLWLISEPDIPGPRQCEAYHAPSSVASFGSLNVFRKERKPPAAGKATNCVSCSIEKDCHFSAPKIYWEKGVCANLGGWPADVVVPDIEDLLDQGGLEAVRHGLNRRLTEDYTQDMPVQEIESRPWYGRCVYEGDNDVCDDQVVYITWDSNADTGSTAKRATFHMTAFTDGVCTKKTQIFGTKGEIQTDGRLIAVHNFVTGETQEIRPPVSAGGHNGGDFGLLKQFVLAIDAVKNGRMSLDEAQLEFIGCTARDIITSHAMVFAAEDARKTNSSVDWNKWWKEHVSNFDCR